MQAQPETSTSEAAPPDIATMRDSARRALGGLTPAPTADELDTLALALRGHIGLLIPEVQQAARRWPIDDIPRNVALACCREAERKLRLGDGDTIPLRVAVAQKLARCVIALCTHYESLAGA